MVYHSIRHLVWVLIIMKLKNLEPLLKLLCFQKVSFHCVSIYPWQKLFVISICSFSTEVYFVLSNIEEQYQWLEQDLIAANSAANRSTRPWIIAYGHRPFYCSNIDPTDCNVSTSRIRLGYVLGLSCLLQ